MATSVQASSEMLSVLRDIYESEELKIDSVRSKTMKETINELCVKENEEFRAIFVRISEDIEEREKSKGWKGSPQNVFSFVAESELLTNLGEVVPGSITDPILWQMIVERLMNISSDNPAAQEESVRKFSVIEENAIYYAAGFVIRKLLKKYMQYANDKAMAFVGTLLILIGEDVGENVSDTSTYLEYIKIWTNNTDRGGLRHVTDDTYRCFLVIESIVYNILKRGGLKEEVFSEVVSSENVRFHWEVAITEEINDYTLELLHEVVNLWFTVRGFSIASRLLEEYKKATKTTIKGKKGLRKELH